MKSYFQLFVLFIIGLILCATTHELGHLLSALIFNIELIEVRLISFIQVFPKIMLVNFNSDLGAVIINIPKSETALGFFYLSGSALNSILALLGAIFVHSQAIDLRKSLLIYLILLVMSVDIIFYSVFPLIGIPHWIIIGGTSPEPLEGALLLGISRFGYFTLILIYSIFVYFLIIKRLKKIILDLIRNKNSVHNT